MKLRCMKWGKKSLALSVATALVLSVPVGFCSTENAQAKSHSETQQSQTVDGIQLQTEANKAGVKVLSKSKAKKKTKRKIDAVSYRMKLKLDTKKDRLYETVTVKVKNNTKKTVSTLCLRDMTPAKLKYDGDNYGNQNKKKRSKVLSVTLAGKKKKLKVTYKQGNSVLYVKLGSKGKIKPGKTKSVTIRMWTDIPDRQDRFGYQKTKQGKLYALSFCFPYLADNVNGKWINDPYFDDGESRSYDLADYDVTFQAPKSYAVATVGKSTTKKGKTKITAKKARDFAIVACNFMKKDSFKVGKIKVNNYYLKGSRHLAKYRKLTKLTAQDSIRLFQKKVGKCPYKEIDIVPCLFGFMTGGMEYPGLVMVNATSWFDSSYYDGISLLECVSHEIGHQWFYAAVGNCEYREAWIDEGFTTYLEREIFEVTPGAANTYLRQIDPIALPIKDIKKDSAYLLSVARTDYAGMKINTRPDRYSADQSYGAAEYEEACMFLQEVREQMGRKKFARFLKDYYQTFYFKTATTKKVIKMIRSYDNSRKMNEIIRFYVG